MGILNVIMGAPPIKIYTDGSCSPNPGPGGWAAVLLFDQGGRVVELQGAEKQSTNNRMELTAALKALESLEERSNVEVFTDSRYLQRGINEWLKKWQVNGWITAEGEPVKNRDLWHSFSHQLHRHNITWTWVKGHSKNSWNERADLLASAARKSRSSPTIPHDPRGVHLYAGVTWKNSNNSGAWAVILNYSRHYKVIGGKSEKTTANRLYLHAVLEGITSLRRVVPVYIYTRSGYLRDGIETWIDSWQRRDWLTREGAVVSNVEQWRRLALLKEKFAIRIIPGPVEESFCHLQEAKELAREFAEQQF